MSALINHDSPGTTTLGDMEATATHCPYCAFQCGMQVTETPRGYEIQPSDFPLNNGALCIKCWTAGSTVRKGDILAVVDTRDEVLKYTGRFLQYYRENARYLERTCDFVPRVGIGELRRVLVEDQSGIAGRLDRDVDIAAAEYRDSWKEGDKPLYPAQFSEEPVAVPEAAVSP